MITKESMGLLSLSIPTWRHRAAFRVSPQGTVNDVVDRSIQKKLTNLPFQPITEILTSARYWNEAPFLPRATCLLHRKNILSPSGIQSD
jgi:hypothetical protein